MGTLNYSKYLLNKIYSNRIYSWLKFLNLELNNDARIGSLVAFSSDEFLIQLQCFELRRV